jgi:tRNA(Ile)-lysidine synthetase-like protein
MKRNWHPLDHQVYRELTAEKPRLKKWAVMVSGGLDSMVLLEIMSRIHSALGIDLSVVHFHHGSALEFKEQSDFRDQASQLVREFCEKNEIPMQAIVSKDYLKSEEGAREFRLEAVHRLRSGNERPEGFDFFLWAHHESDLLETQFLRLIRGAGFEKAISPMKVWDDCHLRPLLHISKQDLLSYQVENHVPFIEDPSNATKEPLRNWLRHDWLPLLEKKSPGSLRSFARSLVLLLEKHSDGSFADLLIKSESDFSAMGDRFRRSMYDQMSLSQKRMLITQCFRAHRAKNYSKNHILEVIKHLDKADKVHRFKVASLYWSVESEMVHISSAL